MGIHQSDWQVYDNRGVRKYLNGAERARFLATADRLDPTERALCYVLAYTGARISETLALAPHMIDAGSLTVRFRTLKQRRLLFRHVPVPESIIAMLADLPVGPGERFWPMHRSTAWRLIRQVMHSAGIAGPMATCKGLRHGWGILAATRNVPGPIIQKALGHSAASTTAIYIDAVGSEEREFVSRMW